MPCHRVTTKEVDGRSKEIVIKWNRMGQDIPGETRAVDAANGRVQQPVHGVQPGLELRNTRFESPGRLYTHKPLAIYVPRKYVEGEQLGRRRHKMEAIQRSHDEIAHRLEPQLRRDLRVAQGHRRRRGLPRGPAGPRRAMADLIERSNDDLDDKGFTVSDNKPQHIIVRPTADGELVEGPTGKPLYGLVDFELLKRTPEREERMRAEKRHDYLVRQAHRFEPHEQFPAGAHAGDDHGRRLRLRPGGEHRRGAVGGRPRPDAVRLLPAREMAAHAAHAAQHAQYEIYETVTKDNVHLVWRVSRVGQIPDADPFVRREKRILDYGYNSPFEEFSIAMELSRTGDRDDLSPGDLHDRPPVDRLVVAGRRQPLREPRRPARRPTGIRSSAGTTST